MNVRTKFSLKFLSVLSLIAQIVFVLVAILLVFCGVTMFIPFIRDEVGGNFTLGTKTINMNGPLTGDIYMLVGLLFLALIVLGVLFLIAGALKKLLGNIERQQFFTVNNLYYLRRILIYIWSGIILQVIFIIISSVWGVYGNMGSLFSDLGYLLASFAFLAVFYTSYTLIKNGTELKNENNSFV